MDHTTKWVKFCVSNEFYCINATAVKEVFTFTESTPIPGTSPEVIGVYNLRGQILPIVDGGLLFSEKELEIKTTSQVIAVHMINEIVGILVDTVCEMINIDTENIVPHTNEHSETKNRLIKGTYIEQNQLTIAVNINEKRSTELILKNPQSST